MVYLMYVLAAIFTLNASPSFADNCGKDDRVSVPACVKLSGASIIKRGATYAGWDVANRCEHPVTLKFDQPGKDVRITVGTPERVKVDADRSAKISCCPRYNSCENIDRGCRIIVNNAKKKGKARFFATLIRDDCKIMHKKLLLDNGGGGNDKVCQHAWNSLGSKDILLNLLSFFLKAGCPSNFFDASDVLSISDIPSLPAVEPSTPSDTPSPHTTEPDDKSLDIAGGKSANCDDSNSACKPVTSDCAKVVKLRNQQTNRYALSTGSPVADGEGGWLKSPKVVGTDGNYYGRAEWCLIQKGEVYLFKNKHTERYILSTGGKYTAPDKEGGWLKSPLIVGADANYYNRAMWKLTKHGDAYLLKNSETNRYLFSTGGKRTGPDGDEGGWLKSPSLVGTDTNYYGRALWYIEGF
jgi:hypothetical protein